MIEKNVPSKLMDLKPCPFCGGEAQIVFADNEIQAYFIECKKCRIRLDVNNGHQANLEQTVEAWNRRVKEN